MVVAAENTVGEKEVAYIVAVVVLEQVAAAGIADLWVPVSD